MLSITRARRRARAVAAILFCLSAPGQATVLVANVVNFAVSPIGTTGSVTGINSGIFNFVELEIPALSVFTISFTTSSGGSIDYLGALGNTGYNVPTGSGYSYSWTQSTAGGFQDVGGAYLYDASFNFLSQITPGYLHSSAFIAADLTTGVATFSNYQTGGPALLEIDFKGSGTLNTSAPILSATFSVSQIPEPTTLALLGLGLVGAALVRRRRVH